MRDEYPLRRAFSRRCGWHQRKHHEPAVRHFGRRAGRQPLHVLDQNGKPAYQLSTPQKDLKQYAGEKVEIAGELDEEGKHITASKTKAIGDTDTH
jgi:hypothetical protein